MTIQWLPPYSATIYIGVLLACLLVIWLARRWATSPLAQGWLLMALRAVLLGLLIVLLLNPTEVTEIKAPPSPAEMVFLVDCSQSMGLDRPISRLEQVKRVLQQSITPSSATSSVRPVVYRFGRQVSAISSLDELQADDDATRLLDPLERLPAQCGANRPAGVVILSDGRTTETSGFKEIAEIYKTWKVPLHVFPVSDQGMVGDIAIQELVVPRLAPPGTRVPVHVQITSHGFQGRRAEIRIRRANDRWAKPLASLPVTLLGGPQSHDMLIEPDTSLRELMLEVSPLPGEAITENNRVPFQIASVVKKLRVIYMEATLGDEYQWLREAITEDPNIECLAMEVQQQFTSNQRLQRVDDPARGYPETREELFRYDVVICSDISRAAFTQDQLNWTRELVARRGGGFAMVGGNTSFGAGGWDRTVWDELIPVKMSGERPGSLGEGYTFGQLRVVIPGAVERHPIWRMAEDPLLNISILNRMPAFSGTNLIDRVKPGATVLGRTDRAMPYAGIMPVFACQSFGKGRTFAMTTDTTATWGREFESTWGEGGDNRYFRKFWRNVVKWLGENSITGSQRLRVETDKVIYRPGQPIQVSARAFDDKREESVKYQIVARLKLPAPTTDSMAPEAQPTLEESPLLPGAGEVIYRGRLTAPTIVAMKSPSPATASSLRTAVLEVVAYDQGRVAGREELNVQVLDDSAEFHDLQSDPQRLEELARLSGGKVAYTAKDLTKLLATAKPADGETVVSRQPAWDRPAFWLLLLMLLVVEWIVRRYRGLA